MVHISTKAETLSDMLPPQDELEADLARLAELQTLRAENEHLKQEIRELTDLYTTYRGVFHDGVQVADVIAALRRQLAESRAETEQLQAAIELTWRPEVKALRARIEALARDNCG